jgi:hypothetical protein
MRSQALKREPSDGSHRDHHEPDLKAVVANTELQALLKKDEAHRDLIRDLVRMNKSGRNGAPMDPTNTLAGLSVVGSFSDNVDCMSLHLRENKSLC